MNYTFDWRREPEGFLRWLVVNLLTDPSDPTYGDDLVNRVLAASSDLTEVTLTIQLSGVEVSTEYFVDRVRANMDHLAHREAARLLRETADLAGLRQQVSDLEEAIIDKIIELTAETDVAVDWDREDYR